MENPGAEPATPMIIDSKNDREFAFNSVLIIPVLLVIV
jgi:hypothetical protein